LTDSYPSTANVKENKHRKSRTKCTAFQQTRTDMMGENQMPLAVPEEVQNK